MKKTVKRVLSAAAVLVLLISAGAAAFADSPTDEILNFDIDVSVNGDASLLMTYTIDWKVLDSDMYGPLEWADIGTPNSHHSNLTPLSDTVERIEDRGSSLAIYLDRPYYAGETVKFSYSFVQDNMYQINKFTEGETVYSFTPAWFDSMTVDNLRISWDMDRALAWQPECLMEDGCLVWNKSLGFGDRYTVSVTYENDAFAFSQDHQASGSKEYRSGGESGSLLTETIEVLIGAAIVFGLPIVLFVKLCRWILNLGRGFGSTEKEQKKIVRTKIEYYPSCPGCGAVRKEGSDVCEYCGRSMIKSRDIVEEKEIENPQKYTKKGTYRYGDSGDTYIRVNVINVPVSSPRPSARHSGSSGRSGYSGGRSSGGSSCVCASSCACVSSCACACACASSGRAGCSVKDFFSSDRHNRKVKVEKR